MLAATLLSHFIHMLLCIRHHINTIILKNEDGLELSVRDFSVFWLSFDMILISPFIFNYYHIGRHISLPLFSALFLVIPIIYSIIWIATKKFRLRAILAVIVAIPGAAIVAVTQLTCIAINILKRLTTSSNYEGKINYMRITPY